MAKLEEQINALQAQIEETLVAAIESGSAVKEETYGMVIIDGIHVFYDMDYKPYISLSFKSEKLRSILRRTNKELEMQADYLRSRLQVVENELAERKA